MLTLYLSLPSVTCIIFTKPLNHTYRLLQSKWLPSGANGYLQGASQKTKHQVTFVVRTGSPLDNRGLNAVHSKKSLKYVVLPIFYIL